MDRRKLITLVLILHGRHENLDRQLVYYKESGIPILVADSSKEKHVFSQPILDNLLYEYTPGITYTQKIEHVLQIVNTPYVVLCADDDFIVPEGIDACIEFLEKNKDYSVAQGLIIRYYKELVNNKVRFDTLYENNISNDSDNVETRLFQLFNPYKSLLYAVHRTDLLKKTFISAGNSIKNLFLNEYLVSIIPTLFGKTKELDSLYQIREFALDSDDKTSINLDVLLFDDKMKLEYESFLELIVNNSKQINTLNGAISKENLKKIIDSYVHQLIVFKKKKKSIKKLLGQIIFLLPIIGKIIIEENRMIESEAKLSLQLKKEHYYQLTIIRKILIK
jgi:glycosyltransferase domain-containing protein